MRIFVFPVCAALIVIAAGPVSAHRACRGGQCGYRPAVTLSKCCRRPPSGWGWYLRQKLRDDCRPPLVIYDELGGVRLVRDRR